MLKPIIAVAVALGICFYYDLDIVAAVLEPQGITTLGISITALIVAGGSAAAVKLFQDVLGFSKEARQARRELNALKAEADLEEAKARVAVAKAGSA